jgi:hypothetical protein
VKTLLQLEILIAESRSAGGTHDLADAGGWLLTARKNYFRDSVIGRCRWWWWILRTLRLEAREALDLLARAHRMEAAMARHICAFYQRLIDEHQAGRPLTEEETSTLAEKLKAMIAGHNQGESNGAGQ